MNCPVCNNPTNSCPVLFTPLLCGECKQGNQKLIPDEIFKLTWDGNKFETEGDPMPITDDMPASILNKFGCGE